MLSLLDRERAVGGVDRTHASLVAAVRELRGILVPAAAPAPHADKRAQRRNTDWLNEARSARRERARHATDAYPKKRWRPASGGLPRHHRKELQQQGGCLRSRGSTPR